MDSNAHFEIPTAALESYILRRAEDLEKCKAALLNDDFDSIRKAGHKMKGNGATFGFAELSALGAALETAAIEKNKEVVESSLTEFSAWLQSHSKK